MGSKFMRQTKWTWDRGPELYRKDVSRRYFVIGLALCAGVLWYAWFSSVYVAAAPTNESCFTFDNGTGTITAYTPNPPLCPLDVEIPETIGGVTVEHVGGFSNSGLTSVTIPNTVTTISPWAFAHNSLTTISLPPTLQFIGQRAFHFNELTSVDIPNTVTVLEDEAFNHNQLTNVVLSSGLAVIPYYAFAENRITHINIPEGITEIGTNAFRSNRISSLTLPSTLLAIDDLAFAANYIESIALPNSLESIGFQAFVQNRLTSVVLPDSLTFIGPMAFAAQSSLGADANQEISSGDPVRVQAAMEGFWYVQAFTESQGNPNGYSDDLVTEAVFGMDINGDSDMDDSIGGHLINPAHINIIYENQDGDGVTTSNFLAGPGLGSYLAHLNISNDADAYFRPGDVYTITPPSVAGYATPGEHEFTFVLGANTYMFSYTALGSSGGGLASEGEGSESGASAGGDELADTGSNTITGLVLAGFIVVVVAVLFNSNNRRKTFRAV